jgi:Zeta toxin
MTDTAPLVGDADLFLAWLNNLSGETPDPAILASLEDQAAERGWSMTAALSALTAGPLGKVRKALGGWDPDLHPRGNDGQFINSGGAVRLRGNGPNGTKLDGLRGVVQGIDPDPKSPGRPNIRVGLYDPRKPGKPVRTISVKPDQISADMSKARLDQVGPSGQKNLKGQSLTPQRFDPAGDHLAQFENGNPLAPNGNDDYGATAARALSDEDLDKAIRMRREDVDFKRGLSPQQDLRVLQKEKARRGPVKDSNYYGFDENKPPDYRRNPADVLAPAGDTYRRNPADVLGPAPNTYRRNPADVFGPADTGQPAFVPVQPKKLAAFKPDEDHVEQFRGGNPLAPNGNDDFGRAATAMLSDDELDQVIAMRQQEIADGQKGMSLQQDLRVLQAERDRRTSLFGPKKGGSPTPPPGEPSKTGPPRSIEAQRAALIASINEQAANLSKVDADERYDQMESFMGKMRFSVIDTDKVHDHLTPPDPESGKWTPERHAMHEQMWSELMEQVTAAGIPKDHDAFVLGGLPGAGKSYTLRPGQKADGFGVVAWEPNGPPPAGATHISINPDIVKEMLIAHGALPEGISPDLKPMEQVTFIHEESSAVAKMFSSRLADEGYNIVLDNTMDSPSAMLKRMEPLAEEGYKFRALFVDIPVEESLISAEKRYKDQALSPQGGRFVPSSVQGNRKSPKGTLSKNRDTMDTLVAEDWFDSYMVVNNSGISERKPLGEVTATGTGNGTAVAKYAQAPAAPTARSTPEAPAAPAAPPTRAETVQAANQDMLDGIRAGRDMGGAAQIRAQRLAGGWKALKSASDATAGDQANDLRAEVDALAQTLRVGGNDKGADALLRAFGNLSALAGDRFPRSFGTFSLAEMENLVKAGRPANASEWQWANLLKALEAKRGSPG